MMTRPSDPAFVSTDGLPIDPVCGMEVDPDTELRADYGGHTYYFCNPSCLTRFTADPRAALRPAPPRQTSKFVRSRAFIGSAAAAYCGMTTPSTSFSRACQYAAEPPISSYEPLMAASFSRAEAAIRFSN